MMLLGLFYCHEAKAESKNFYAKVTLEVAEDSKGLGRVYMLDNNDEEVMEAVNMGSQYGMNDGAPVGFAIYNEPADGYVLTHFTDQNGEEYYYPDDEYGSNMNNISVFGMSADESDPTPYTLSAHFALASSLPKENLAEATVSAEMKFGTFMSPVEMEIPEDFQVYVVDAVSDDAVVLTQNKTGILPAFTPVLLENVSMFDATISTTYSDEDIPEELPSLSTGLLTGVIEDSMAPFGSYVIEPSEDVEAHFVRVADEETFLYPFSCYMNVDDSDLDAYRIQTLPVAVRSLLEDSTAPEIYDLEGRRLENLRPGVNIINGKKIIVK